MSFSVPFYSEPKPKYAKFGRCLLVKQYGNAAGRMRVCPVEVKSTKRYSTVSLDKFKAKFDSRIGMQYVLHPKPVKADGDRLYLPLYMAYCL